METQRTWGPEDEPDEEIRVLTTGPDDEPEDEGTEEGSMEDLAPSLDGRLAEEFDAALD